MELRVTKVPQTPTVADAYLQLLASLGVDYLFANAGTDFPPIVEALARARATGARVPNAVVIPHEQTAISMAHGYWLVSGRTQAVMLHVSVGTANAVCGVMNAARENVPVLLTAGRSPLTESGLPGSRSAPIHWAQEMFDQAGMLRELVKWDYQLAGGHELAEIVGRALAIAETEPRGPVYLSLPREALAAPQAEATLPGQRRITAASPAHPDPAAIEAAAALIAEARFPLIVAGRAGQDVQAVPRLAELCSRHAIPVVEFWSSYLGLPSTHPMHLGYDIDAVVGDADLIIALDCDVPWLPDHKVPAEGCRVVQIGPDPLFANYPVRNFPSDVAITSSCAQALSALDAALTERESDMRPRLDARRADIAERHRARRADVRARLEREADAPRMTKEFVSWQLGQIKDDDAIVFNEYPLRRDQIDFNQPGTFFDQCSAAGLGWGVGAALGAKLARPERQVIAVVGDGSYIFSNPTASHQVAQALNLPILIVIYNNARWDAVRMSTEWMYPDGAALTSNAVPLTSLDPAPAYELYAQASGGYGERVTDPNDLVPALRRALAEVAAGRHALLNVIGE